jgi:hypothetical protein
MTTPKLRFFHGIVLASVIPFVQSEATSFDADLGPESQVRNVIFLTWDGVRPHEFFQGPDQNLSAGDSADTLPWFRANLEHLGKTYGGPENTMTVGNTVMMSLPGYQSIFAGRPTSCFDNYCGRIEESTVSERIVQSFGLEKEKVAHIASWHSIKFAAERRKGSVFVNAGFEPLQDNAPDSVQDQINLEQSENRPVWHAARHDEHTMKHALHYLQKHQPRFMHIGLNDSDEWAHRGDYSNYLSSIRQYDLWLEELVEHLKNLGEYGRNTCIVITTDHGRGKDEKWTKHSNGVVESALVWMHASCPFLADEVSFIERQYLTTHLDIRPTIEDLMGIRPRACVGCGSSLLNR